jgi:hypothetical protein
MMPKILNMEERKLDKETCKSKNILEYVPKNERNQKFMADELI